MTDVEDKFVFLGVRNRWARTSRGVRRLTRVLSYRLIYSTTGLWQVSNMPLWTCVTILYGPWEYILGREPWDG